MISHKITLIPGDGIGPEVIQATVRMLEATAVKFEWESFAAGAEAFEKYKEYIPKELSESIERTRVGLKGPVTTPIGGGFASINVELRKQFELFANFRPIRNLPHIPTRYPGVDLIVVRPKRERACFVDEFLVPAAADEEQAALFGEGDPRKGTCDLVTLDLHTS